MLCETFPHAVRRYDHRLKIGGYKIFLDGSPQGKTAWMKTPYQTGSGNDAGYGTMRNEEVLFAAKKAVENQMQLLAHCNGDAACEQYLCAAEKTPGIAKIRPVMIHAQLLQPEQMDAVKNCGMIPSFFIGHVFYWGETHIQNFGFARAEKISPAASALKKGILFTFHQDSPVTEPNMLETVWCAVNRITKTGKVLGTDEKIPVLEAIRAVTINAAYQYFEETEKGSLSPGKTADLVVLDQNPLKTAPEKINRISVVRTVKNGQTIFEA